MTFNSPSQYLSIHIIIKQFQACQTQKIWPASELLPKPRQRSKRTLVLHRAHRDSTSGMRSTPVFGRSENNYKMLFPCHWQMLRVFVSVRYFLCQMTACVGYSCFCIVDWSCVRLLCVWCLCICVCVVECMRCNGETYRGPMDHTESGKACQRWDSQKPHKHTYQPHRYTNTHTVHTQTHTQGTDLRQPTLCVPYVQACW